MKFYSIHKKLLLPIIIITIIGIMPCYYESIEIGIIPSFLDYMFYFWRGIREFTLQDPGFFREIPLPFLAFILYSCFISLLNIQERFLERGEQLFLRFYSRERWWKIECFNSVFLTVLILSLHIITILIFTVFFSAVKGDLNTVFGTGGIGFAKIQISKQEILYRGLIVFLGMNAFQLASEVLGLYFKISASFLMILSYITLSLFFSGSIFFMNNMMMLRIENFDIKSQIIGFSTILIVIVSSVLGGYIKVKTINIMTRLK